MNVLIIGATSGIGNALWKHYTAKGDMVVAIGRRLENLNEMMTGAPGHTIPVQCDIANINSFNEAFACICDRLQTIDLVIVCASIGELNPELDVKTELHTLEVNVRGWTNCVDNAYNYFSRQGYGHLVTITSVGGLQPASIAPSYSASKAFQINYTGALRQKAKGSDIIVTEIRPGLVDTRMAKGEGLFWVMPLDKTADSIIRVIGKKRSRAIISGRWRIINFLLKHFM